MDLAHPVFQVVAAGNANALIQLLKDDPQLINRPDYDGNMPLHLAALSGSVECVRACLEALEQRTDLDLQTEINRKNFMNRDSLSCAVISSNIEIASLLIEFGARTNYRYSTEVIPLVESLNGPDISMTQFLLEVLDVDFDRSRMDQYWFSALQSDLSITLGHFKLLRSHAVPYGIGEFEELCLNMLEWNPKTKGLEDFLVYLCTDAVDRWSRQRDEIDKGLRRISSFFLRKLVPCTQSFSCVRRLQRLGVFEPPVSARAWLRVLSEWGLPTSKFSRADVQDSLLDEFILPVDASSSSSSLCPIIHNRSLIPLVLYFAVLALKFPKPDWLVQWNRLCVEAGFPDCRLSTLLELHTVRHSRSASDFFWFEIFPFALSRAITFDDDPHVNIPSLYQQLVALVEHVSANCPSISPTQLSSQNSTFFLNFLSCFPGSSPVPGHSLFIQFASDFILPWIPDVDWSSVRTRCLVTATVHALSHRRLLESILDFSPSLAHYLISNVTDWPHKAHCHVGLLLDCLILAYSESFLRLSPPRDLNKLFLVNAPDTSSLTFPSALLISWLHRPQEHPPRLLCITKRFVRLLLRSHQKTKVPRPALSHLVGSLAVPQTVRDWLLRYNQ